MAQDEVLTRVSTGIAGLNEILHGGLVRERSYLVRGGPGTGKTTMGMHFWQQGLRLEKPYCGSVWVSPKRSCGKMPWLRGLTSKASRFSI
jgi:predicted ATP-dependent serine protease